MVGYALGAAIQKFLETAASVNTSAAETTSGNSERWHVLMASFLSYGFDGMDFMVLSLALAAITSEWHLTLGEAGLLGTAGMIGVGFSSVLIGWYSDNYGRRRALLVSVATFAIFTTSIAAARGWWDVLVLRFIAGLGLGGVWGVVSAYINESWPPQYRGRAIAFVLSSWPIGFIAAAAIARWVLPAYGWRTLFAFGGLAFVATPYIWKFVPESAVWRRERDERMSAGDQARVAVGEIFGRGLLFRTLLGTFAAACALTGYWAVNTWLPTYLVRDRGLNQASMATYIIVLNIGTFFGYQIFGYIADRIGRRKALILCFFGATVMLPVYAATRDSTLLLLIGPVLALFFSFTGAFGSYFPELYPTRMRSLGAGFCFNMGRGVAAFAPFALGQMATTLGLATSLGLCAFAFLLAGLSMVFMPEI
jgi:MFS family permease